MSLRTWLQGFVTLGALTWTALDTSAAFAQAPAAPTPPSTGQTPTLPDVNVIAEPPAPNLTPNFEPFAQTTIVQQNAFQAAPVTGYQAPSSTTGSWIDMPKLSYPGSIDTFTQPMRHDQQVINTDDMIRDIAGAVKANGNGGDGVRRPDQFLLRGFELTTQNFRKNGFLDPTQTPRDYANVERVDVLKGPSSIAYGSALPSGTFNVTTKRAQQDRFAVATAQLGSWDFNRYTFDVNNMNQAEDILFRINAAHQQGNNFRQFGSNERVFVAPTLTFILSDDTILTYEAEFNHDRRQYDTGLIAVNGDPRAFPRNRFNGNPSDLMKFNDYRNSLMLTHNINDDWSVYMGGMSLFYDQQIQGHQPAGGIPGVFNLVAPGTLYTNPAAAVPFIPDLAIGQFSGGQSGQNQALVANLNGRFDGPMFEHNVLVGTEENWYFQSASFPVAYGLYNASQTTPPPVLAQQGSFFFPGMFQRRSSVYFQDLVSLTERLKVLYGARYDHINQTLDRDLSGGMLPPVMTKQEFQQGTPRVGLIFDAVPDALSFYSMWTSSFNPIGGSAIGTPLPGANTNPETAQIFESGVKANIFDNLTYTFGVFNIERQNVAVVPGANPFQYAQANQRSKGIEMTLVGNWTERLSTISNYSYTDAKQADPTAGPDSDLNGRIRGVPFNLGNVWTRYNFIQNRSTVVGAAMGWVYVGERRGDYGSSLRLDSYNRWDLGLFGTFGRLDTAGYLENIFNARYETGSISQYQVFPGAPVNFRLQAGITF